MPGEFEGAARIGVRAVAFFADGHGFQHAASGDVFFLQHRQKDVGEKFCLLGRHGEPSFAEPGDRNYIVGRN